MFHNRLRELRNQSSISQKELASKLFVSQQTVAKWETNKSSPNPEMLAKLASLFGVSVDYLVGTSDRKEKLTTPKDDELSQLLEDPDTKALYERIKDFSEDELEDLLNYSEYLISKRDSRKKK